MTARIDTPCLNANRANAQPQSETESAAKIRALNDRLRTEGRGGQVLFTRGIIDQGLTFAGAVLASLRAFNQFDGGNDPWAEHDFGKFEIDGQAVLWKVDCYDRTMTCHSPDPADAAITRRVLTVMLSHEY